MPLITGKGQNALTGKADTLALEHEALKLIVAHAVGTRAGATLNVDDAMPRDAAVIGKGVEGVANEAGVTGKTREERDLAVGGNAAARDAPNDGED